MASIVTICNGALIKVGARRITALNENTVEAKLLNDRYNELRLELLRSHPWRFAVVWGDPAEVLSPTHQTRYDNVFQVPTDCLRILETDYPEDHWVVEGNYVSACVNPLKIRYIKDITDPNLMDENFREVLSCKIAADICYTLTQNATLRGQLVEEYERRLRTARSFSAQETSPPRVYADQWLNRRRSGSSLL